MNLLLSRGVNTRELPCVEVEASELELVRHCRRRWPLLGEIPINQWFLPDLSKPVNYMITTIFKED